LVGAAVGVVRLDRRNRRADVRLSSRPVRAGLEAEVRRHRNREQDADDHDHDEELDQSEALLTSQTLPQTIHEISLSKDVGVQSDNRLLTKSGLASFE